MSESVPAVEDSEGLAGPRVEALDYIGGEGGFCEPLVVHHEGAEYYLLHEMYLKNDKAGRWDEDNWTAVHRKVEYGSREELEAAFDEVQHRLTIDETLEWEETDRTLGFTVSEQLFLGATLKICQVPWDQRRK